MKNIMLICLIFIGLPFFLLAQKKNKTVRVSAKIEVLMEGNYSKDAIKEKAVQAAKIKALGDEFGYSIIQGINTQTKTNSDNAVLTSTRLSEVSNTLVKGEWIADDKNYPKTKFIIRDKGEDQEIWLLCEVSGTARVLSEAPVSFESFTYSCDKPRDCITGQFKHGDSMFLYFKSPVKGFLSVFMVENGLVYRLLPYAQMGDAYESAVPIESDKDYELFSPRHFDYFEHFSQVDEYGLETDEDGEPVSNLLYVVFSTKPFQKPALQASENGIKSLELPKFQTWLNQNKGLDKNFQVSRLSVTVNK
jgi:hypothetical protein